MSDYGLDNGLYEIGTAKKAVQLYISRDSTTGRTIYPPLSVLGEEISAPRFRRLPDQITTLTNLKSLKLVGLDLVTLPDSFYRLENLDPLILFMKKLTISNELEKLKKLEKLKYMDLQGNKLTASDLFELTKAIPDIITNPALRYTEQKIEDLEFATTLRLK